ncbi:hypothetical protein QYM36_008218 [Artemia franciscana]|uniref:Uncharacterized protein n=1 Tax=Artemia franciscana TaxID=6661 RepID=A0AA88IUL3_ARTSF|nr:hypothetical protein QYM36_008218 [Artemia franciscana]
MSEEKTTGDLYESQEEDLICNEFGRKIANQLIDMKQDIAIRKTCIFIEHVGKQFSKNNKQLIFAIQKYGKDSQLPIRDKFKIKDLTDLVEKKWNIDLSQDDIIVTSKVPKHSSIEELKLVQIRMKIHLFWKRLVAGLHYLQHQPLRQSPPKTKL